MAAKKKREALHESLRVASDAYDAAWTSLRKEANEDLPRNLATGLDYVGFKARQARLYESMERLKEAARHLDKASATNASAYHKLIELTRVTHQYMDMLQRE